MSKNKKNKKNATEKVTDKGFVDEQILSQAIVKAYFEIEDKKKEKEQKLAEKEQKEWLKVLGQKEYPENEKWFLKIIHLLRNDIVGVWKLMFIKSKDVKNARATFGLISMAISMIFKGCEILLYLLSACVFYFSVTHKLYIIIGIALSIFLFMIARLFRLALFEIDKMKDAEMLLGIFSAVLTSVTVIVPIITFLINKLT